MLGKERWSTALGSCVALWLGLAGCNGDGEPGEQVPSDVSDADLEAAPDAAYDSAAADGAGETVAPADTSTGCPHAVEITPILPRTGDPLVAATPGYFGPLTVTWFEVIDGARTQVGSGLVLPASATAKGRLYEAAAASTLRSECTPAVDSVTIRNTAPTVAAVLLSPSAVTVDGELSCNVPAGAWLDPDEGDPVAPAWSWYIGQELVAGETGPTLSSVFGKFQLVRCRVVPSDGEDAGQAVDSAPVPVLNSTPSVEAASLPCPSPGAAFHCTATGTDPDGDAPSFLFAWRLGQGDCDTATAIQTDSQAVDGALGSTLELVPPKGAAVFCCATPVDEDGLHGPPKATASCTVGNAPPVVTGALVSTAPEVPPNAQATLSCSAQATDPDGETITTSCQWLVDGDAVDEPGCTLDGGFVKGQTVCCQVVASDGVDTTVGGSKTCLTIGDSPPKVTALGLNPADGDHCEPPSCNALGVDPDGEEVQLSYAWTLDGAPVPGPPPAVPGETVGCTAIPSAGGVVGESASATITISNDIPSIASVNLAVDPEPATAASTVSCVPGGWDDDDACDVPGFSYSWYVGGELVEGETNPTLSPKSFTKGDTVLCLVTPFDGFESGTPVQSPVVTIANALPAVLTVSVSPPVGNQSTTFACQTEGLDPDGDELTWVYSWAVDGVVVPSLTGENATGVPFSKNGALLTCTAQPFDTAAAGPVTPSANAAVLVNAAPVAAKVAISPPKPTTSDDLVCSAEATDPDGDAITLAFEWFLIGPGGPAVIANQSEAVLPASATQHFDSIYCRATPSDGTSTGTAATSTSVLVANTPPTLAQASLTPAGGTPQTLFECVPVGYADVDGDAGSFSFTWLVEDVVVPGATAGSFQPASIDAQVGATVACSAVPSDSYDEGPPTVSNPVVLSACAPDQEGAACDDENACTEEDLCTDGACLGVPTSCDDANPCTADGCSPATGCSHAPLPNPCDDGDPCTEGDSCATGACAGTPLSCDDGNKCTEDLCSPVAGCLHWPGVGECEDGDPCTVGDLCGGGKCLSGGPADCDDGLPCTDDLCLVGFGCNHPHNAGPCDDGNPCSVGDTCAAGSCEPGGAAACDDGNPCTADGCTPAAGCASQPVPDGAACDDGEPCSASDFCLAGTCTGGLPPDCDDDDPCTADLCTPGTGCTHGPGPDDGVLCPGGVCVGGFCCTPDCGGKTCGDDGCGGSCGSCAALEECLDPPGTCSSGLTPSMVLVPSGDFWMGCNSAIDDDCSAHESPYHLVGLKAFEIDTVEVSIEAYEACMEAGPCPQPATIGAGCLYGIAGKELHPVNCVDHGSATAYCQWSGKRLCTEAEWEKAARGTDGRIWPWGNVPASCGLAVMKEASTLGCGLGGPFPTGLNPAGASPYGALDMAGNVSEWVADWYYAQYYASSPPNDPKGPGFGALKVYRGGDFSSNAAEIRASHRFLLQPDNLSSAVGIRCCKDFP